jgi:glycine/D-amino acid oxidase-like deaminating enzyme
MDDEHSRRRSRDVAIEHLRNSDAIVLLDRSSDPEPWTALEAIRELRDHLEEAERRAVVAALAEGASWSRIGHALGCSHQRASSKHRDERAAAIEQHPSVLERSEVDPRMRLLAGGLDASGVVLPDGSWVAHEDLTPDHHAIISDRRTRLSAVPVLEDENAGSAGPGPDG